MCNFKRFSVSSVLWLFLLGIAAHNACAQTPLKTINNAQGGKVVYGLVDGATTPAMAMARILHNVQNNCGDNPQVGKVFRVRGSNSDAVFFTVTNHPGGNVPLAGMLIASQTGPNAVEAALVSDAAARFSSTMNPLLRQLFGVWQPGGGGPKGGAPDGRPAPAEPLHQVWNQDHSAMIAIPNGWVVQGNGGTTFARESNYNAMINLNLVRGATANPNYRPYGGMTTGMGVKMVYPANVDPVRGFPGSYQRVLSREQPTHRLSDRQRRADGRTSRPTLRPCHRTRVAFRGKQAATA